MANWTADLGIGIRGIDEDHARLVFLINELDDAVSARRSALAVRELLEELLAATGAHFCREEQVMRRARYPGLTAHKHQHDALLKELRLMVRAVEGGQRRIDAQTIDWLRIWMSGHVRGQDREMAQFLRGDVAAMALGSVA
ncbi:MAG: hemerythrin family protein [Rhodospirillaceae bacterium]|nr:hemerythrin family protein [Rhodospirillaceae bacterium]